MAYLSFNTGGFFVDGPAVAALVAFVAMLLRLAVAEHPFEGFGLASGLTIGALALFAAWVLVSSAWSDAPGRALLEFDRVLLYLSVLVLGSSVLRTPRRIRLMLYGITLALVAVCMSAVATRVLPDVWQVAPNTADIRLNYPLSYSNALGLLAAFGIVFALHLAGDLRERWHVRVLGAAVLPALAAALVLTLSRGAILGCVLAVLLYAAVGRPRGLATAVAAAGPPTAVSLVVSYRADLLQTPEYASGAALAQGHHVAWIVALCCIASLLVRALLLPVDERLARLKNLGRLHVRAVVGAAAIALTALVVAGLALQAPAYVSRQYEAFLDKSPIPGSSTRLASVSNNGRLDFWDVGLDAWGRDRLKGNGAGSYQLLWARYRPSAAPARDGHSLYVEVLGELGIVGLLLVAGVILLILGRLASLARGPDRALYAAILAAGAAWAMQAGFDWHWEMPAVTLPFFALGGLALASSRPLLRSPGWLTRLILALVLIFIAVAPTRIAVSQHHLNESYEAFREERCDVATTRARQSIKALGLRPEPYEVVAYCAAGARLGRLAVETMEQAVERDPQNWEVHYGLAVARGAARLDPRPAARSALKLNPKEFLTRKAAASFLGTSDPDEWERVARRSSMPAL